MLRVIQLNTLEDRNIHDKQEWDMAVKFFESSVKEKLENTELTLYEMLGPSTVQKWTQWSSSTKDQNKRKQVKGELDKIIHSDSVSDLLFVHVHSRVMTVNQLNFIVSRSRRNTRQH